MIFILKSYADGLIKRFGLVVKLSPIRNYRHSSNTTIQQNNRNNPQNNELKDDKFKQNGFFDKLRDSLKLFIIVISTSWAVTKCLAEPILLQGPSMEPTIQHNDVIIAEKYTVAFKRHDYKRGDIVVVRSPMNPHQFICKRIVALPGDIIEHHRHCFDFSRRLTIPKGHVWLLGDNQANSTDSREFGALPMGLIIGRVMYRIWPLNRIINLQNSIDDNYHYYPK